MHGGPGFNHVYLNCFEDFLPPAGIEFYLYDQLGSLFSDNPDDPKLWTVARYTDEVEQVRKALGLENFYLYGHSWGGLLAYEYALKYPRHLRGVVISNMVASVPRYEAYVARFQNELTPAERKTCRSTKPPTTTTRLNTRRSLWNASIPSTSAAWIHGRPPSN